MDIIRELQDAENRLTTSQQGAYRAVCAYATALAQVRTPSERAARPRELLESVVSAVTDADEAVRAAVAAASRAELAANVEPQLDGEDLARASALREFAIEDVDSARSGDDVARMLDEAFAAGDRARVWLLRRYVRARLAREARSRGGRPIAATPKLRDALARADAGFAAAGRARLLEQAAALRERAATVRSDVSALRCDGAEVG